MRLNKSQCIDRGAYFEYRGDLVTTESLECDFALKVTGSLKVGQWLEVGGSLEVGQLLKVGQWLEVGGRLKVGQWLEVGEWLEVGGSLKVGGWLNFDFILVQTNCKWLIFVSKKGIKIGCEFASVEEWDSRFSQNWHKDTDPNTAEYALIKAAYQVAKCYYDNVLPIILKTKTN